MPKATAVWLVDNTALTFRQIAQFCDLHELEVEGIANGEVAQGIKGVSPVAAGVLSEEELARCSADANAQLTMISRQDDVPDVRRQSGPRYTPLSRRRSRPDAIAWLLRHHPELSNGQISKLIGTTAPTIESIRSRTHFNISAIKPMDPIASGLCTQADLAAALAKAARKSKTAGKQPAAKTPPPSPPPSGQRLLPAEETAKEAESEKSAAKEEYDPDKVFANLPNNKTDDKTA